MSAIKLNELSQFGNGTEDFSPPDMKITELTYCRELAPEPNIAHA